MICARKSTSSLFRNTGIASASPPFHVRLTDKGPDYTQPLLFLFLGSPMPFRDCRSSKHVVFPIVRPGLSLVSGSRTRKPAPFPRDVLVFTPSFGSLCPRARPWSSCRTSMYVELYVDYARATRELIRAAPYSHSALRPLGSPFMPQAQSEGNLT